MSLMEMIKASKSNTDQGEWSNLPKKSDGNCVLKLHIIFEIFGLFFFK